MASLSTRWSGTTRQRMSGRRRLWRRCRRHEGLSAWRCSVASSTRRAARVRTTAQLPMVERYDLATKAWEAVAPMSADRGDLDVAVLDGKLYAVGGFGFNNGHFLTSVERYDPATNAWEAAAPLTTARSFHGITVA
mmetsp:Transcript_12185/g.39712  ORF Transcript_12185/g.39712 Transcript_12185/m.39712 type:complete len:136 (+) Transcript_12185:35-442(+)